MSKQVKENVELADAATDQAWEDMRVELLHELQEGGSTDVPDSTLDAIGNLMVELAAWRFKRHVRTPEELRARALAIVRDVN